MHFAWRNNQASVCRMFISKVICKLLGNLLKSDRLGVSPPPPRCFFWGVGMSLEMLHIYQFKIYEFVTDTVLCIGFELLNEWSLIIKFTPIPTLKRSFWGIWHLPLLQSKYYRYAQVLKTCFVFIVFTWFILMEAAKAKCTLFESDFFNDGYFLLPPKGRKRGFVFPVWLQNVQESPLRCFWNAQVPLSLFVFSVFGIWFLQSVQQFLR